MITNSQLTQVSQDFNSYAREAMNVTRVGHVLYAMGSELGVLRISVHYPKAMLDGKASVEYSTNLKTWFFRLEVE